MSQPSTDNELQTARRRLGAARDACPHWDMADEPPGTFHECCCELANAHDALKRAKARAR